MILKDILEKSGTAEIILRRLLTAFAPIKKNVKRFIRKKVSAPISLYENKELIGKFRNILEKCGTKPGDIIIIHSSLDGLRGMGITAEKIIDLIFEAFSECTVVFAAYPIEPGSKKEIYKYDPQKTLCWTGMLPNAVMKRKGVVRSEFPYNSLCALGKECEAMFMDNMKSFRPHDKYSAWEYCRRHHAKILFLGTTSREANTMAIHMIPDIMGDKWPIANWYTGRKYRIKTNGGYIEKNIEVQDGFWTKYVNEYKTDRILKDNGYIRDISAGGITAELVDDSYEMMRFLLERCENGSPMYKVPKRFYRK